MTLKDELEKLVQKTKLLHLTPGERNEVENVERLIREGYTFTKKES